MLNVVEIFSKMRIEKRILDLVIYKILEMLLRVVWGGKVKFFISY